MRAISPVVAIVVLTLMTVSAAGMAYLTLTNYQEEAQSGSQGVLSFLFRTASSYARIESVGAGIVYLRNLGQEESSNFQVFLNGAPVESDCSPDPLSPGKVAACLLYDLSYTPGIDEIVELKILSDNSETTARVSTSQLILPEGYYFDAGESFQAIALILNSTEDGSGYAGYIDFLDWDTQESFRIRQFNDTGVQKLVTSFNDSTTLTDILTITEQGRVGIGTLTPRQELDVNGSIYSTHYALGSGYIKIGTSSVSEMQPILKGFSESPNIGLYLLAMSPNTTQTGFNDAAYYINARDYNSDPLTTGNLLQVANDGYVKLTMDVDGNVTMTGSLNRINDTSFDSSWGNNTQDAPSMNAIYDELYNYYEPGIIHAEMGFGPALYSYGGPNSDTDARLGANWIIPETRSDWKITIISGTDTATGTITSGLLSAGVTGENETWGHTNIFNAINHDMNHSIAATQYRTSSPTFSATKGDMLAFSWQKDNNAGSGTMYIFNVFLEHD